MFVRLKRRPGFTIIELIITIAVFAILLGMAIPAINSWLPGYRLRSAARDIASNMQLARMRAISVNQNYGVDFDADGTYKIFRDGFPFHQCDENDTIERRNTLPTGVTFSGGTFAATRPAIFRPGGTCNGGTIRVTNPRGTRSIIVSPFTGRIRIK